MQQGHDQRRNNRYAFMSYSSVLKKIEIGTSFFANNVETVGPVKKFFG